MKKITLLLLVLLPTLALANWKNSNTVTASTNYTYLGETLSNDKAAFLSNFAVNHSNGVSVSLGLNTLRVNDKNEAEVLLNLGYSNTISDLAKYSITYTHGVNSSSSDSYYDDVYTTISSNKLQVVNTTLWHAYNINTSKHVASSVTLNRVFNNVNVAATAGKAYDSHYYYQGVASYSFKSYMAKLQYSYLDYQNGLTDNRTVLSLTYNF